jgi:fused signal recognition particle receptor
MFSFFKKKFKNNPAQSDDSQLGGDVAQIEPNQTEDHPGDSSPAFWSTHLTEPLPEQSCAVPLSADPAQGDESSLTAREGTETEQLAKSGPYIEPVQVETEKKSGWLSRLRTGLARTGQSIGGLFVGVKVDEALFEELESALIMADAGVQATEALLLALRARVKKDRLEDAQAVRQALADILAEHLNVLEKPFVVGEFAPLVVMIAGVNGAGKTTSIGKLAYSLQRQGAKVLLAAGDTFRAAAREQLVEWGRRNQVAVIAQDGGDPAAVAFDAVNAGRARAMDVVMIDTAGRLPTQLHLMDELKKIRRVIGKADAQAPHEVLLWLMVIQVKTY